MKITCEEDLKKPVHCVPLCWGACAPQCKDNCKSYQDCFTYRMALRLQGIKRVQIKPKCDNCGSYCYLPKSERLRYNEKDYICNRWSYCRQPVVSLEHMERMVNRDSIGVTGRTE